MEMTDRRHRLSGSGILLLFLLISLAGCAPAPAVGPMCTVLFEDNPSLFYPRQIYEIRRGDDLDISVGVPLGERICAVNYDDYSLSARTGSSASYDYYTLTLHHVRYSAVIRLSSAPAFTTAYHAGGGRGEDILVQEESPHLFFNTLPWRKQFSREGFLPIGWNTAPDGSGTHVGFGSRIDRRGLQHLDLYAEWLPCTPAEAFTYVSTEEGITITGYQGSGNLVLPPAIRSRPVTAVARGAFGDVEADFAALPDTLRTLEEGSFGRLSVRDFYLFDSVEEIPEEAFASYEIASLHINSVLDPVFSGSYFDTFSDKADYLSSLREQDKIVLFCGSSARFGYDSPQIENAFPAYKVVNMGIYAYSNMLPQAKLLLSYMKKGDILLSSPELDAIEMQFCSSTALDRETFCMLESNYDRLAVLDSREFTGIFRAFQEFVRSRMTMPPRSYLDSPSRYDEDGRPQSAPSYNRCGDYILHRENNLSGKSFGVKRAYYNPDHIRAEDLAGLNRVYDALSAQGVQVCFAYSPRSSISISEDSTPESILLLDELLRNGLHARMISSVQASLMDPLYFYGTDNHLSTEGADLHTKQIIEALRPVLEEQP